MPINHPIMDGNIIHHPLKMQRFYPPENLAIHSPAPPRTRIPPRAAGTQRWNLRKGPNKPSTIGEIHGDYNPNGIKL